jgi:hypothetical protein
VTPQRHKKHSQFSLRWRLQTLGGSNQQERAARRWYGRAHACWCDGWQVRVGHMHAKARTDAPPSLPPVSSASQVESQQSIYFQSAKKTTCRCLCACLARRRSRAWPDLHAARRQTGCAAQPAPRGSGRQRRQRANANPSRLADCGSVFATALHAVRRRGRPVWAHLSPFVIAPRLAAA